MQVKRAVNMHKLGQEKDISWQEYSSLLLCSNKQMKSLFDIFVA